MVGTFAPSQEQESKRIINLTCDTLTFYVLENDAVEGDILEAAMAHGARQRCGLRPKLLAARRVGAAAPGVAGAEAAVGARRVRLVARRLLGPARPVVHLHDALGRRGAGVAGGARVGRVRRGASSEAVRSLFRPAVVYKSLLGAVQHIDAGRISHHFVLLDHPLQLGHAGGLRAQYVPGHFASRHQLGRDVAGAADRGAPHAATPRLPASRFRPRLPHLRRNLLLRRWPGPVGQRLGVPGDRLEPARADGGRARRHHAGAGGATPAGGGTDAPARPRRAPPAPQGRALLQLLQRRIRRRVVSALECALRNLCAGGHQTITRRSVPHLNRRIYGRAIRKAMHPC